MAWISEKLKQGKRQASGLNNIDGRSNFASLVFSCLLKCIDNSDWAANLHDDTAMC